MKGLLELIKLIFGPKALSKTIGTRTNVIKLPNNKTKRYTKSDLDIESASDAAAMNAKKEMEKLIAEIPKMNDAERLVFEGNLRRLKNRLGIRSETDPTADVFQFGTKEKVTPGGIASLTEQAGQKSPPGTLMGDLESRINKLKASGKELEDIVKDMGPGVSVSKDPYADIRRLIENPTPEEAAIKAKEKARLSKVFEDVMQSQKTMSKMQDEGLVRAAVRYKMMDDLKRGTLKLPKNLEDVVRGASNEEDVITVFRNNYGEDALEQVDSLIPDFYKMTSPADAVKKIEKDFPNMKPKKIEIKQTMDLDEAMKAEQENILTPGKAIPADSPEGKKITEALIGKPKAEVVSLPTAEKILSDMRNLGPIDAMKEANKVLKREGPYKNLTDKDIEKIMDDINDHIFGGDLPVDPEDFANGGRVGYMGGGSTGLDYLMGIDRKNYQQGSAPVDELIIKLINSGDSTQSPSIAKSPPSTFQPTTMDMLTLLTSPITGVANLKSRRDTGLSLVERAMDAMGISRGIGGRTEGYGIDSVNPMSMSMSSDASVSSDDSTHGVDSVNEGSVGADASAGGAAGAAAASAAGSNDGPGGGTFAQGGRVGFNQGTLNPAKEKQIKQMLKMGADVDTISTITGATPEQIQQIQQTPRIKNSQGGLNYLMGY